MPGVIGGLFAFGIIGLFIGPIVLAVVYTLLKAWVSESGAGKRVLNEKSDSNTGSIVHKQTTDQEK